MKLCNTIGYVGLKGEPGREGYSLSGEKGFKGKIG